MSRWNISRQLADMIPAPAGTTSPKVIFESEDGIVDCYGLTVPTDGTSNYAPGCLFRHVDADVLATGTVDSGDATSLIDLTLASTFDTNDELIGHYVVDTDKQIYGLIDDYAYATGDITVNDWLDYDGTAVAATLYPAAGDSFKILRNSTSVAIYINQGDSIRGCKFKPLISSGLTTFANYDLQTGGASQLWDGVPLLEVMLDPARGFYFFDHFVSNTDVYATTVYNGGILMTQNSGGGTLANDPSVAGGVLKLATGAAADDGPTVQWPALQVTPAAGVHILFEARVKCGEDNDDIFIGLGCDSVTTFLGTGTVITNKDHAGFFRDDGVTDADMGAQACDGTNTTSEDDICTDVDKTAYETYGIHIYGDGDTAGDYVKFYHKGKLVKTITDADGGGDDGVPDGIICPVIELHSDDAGDDALYVDWIRMLVYSDSGSVCV